MGRSSSKPLPSNPLQEIQYKETQRERNRLQQEKEKKQIIQLQRKQAKKQRKINKRKQNSSSHKQVKDQSSITASSHNLKQRNSANNEMSLNFNSQNMSADFHRQLETKIQKQLNENLCEFILNQMALTIQFFKNYDSELSTMAEDMLSNEKLFNKNLEEHSILITNPLDIAVSKWVRYKPFHGPDKHNVQLLQTQTMYVVFENIDITRPNDANYDSISPLCKVDIEFDFRETTPFKDDYLQMLNSIKWKGYVRLKLREDTKHTKAMEGNYEGMYSEGSSGYGTTSPYNSKANLNLGDKSLDLDYDYSFISLLNTQHPLKELKMLNVREQHRIDEKILPESCISSLGNFIQQSLDEEEFTDDEESSESDSDSEYEDSDGGEKAKVYRDYDTLQALKLYRIEMERRRKLLAQNYLNSWEFMKYFGELVRKKLAAKLNVTEAELNKATYRGNSIFTNRYELIPAIYAAQNVSDWPKCAFEFRLRDRPISINPKTGQQIQWPTRAMIKRIETFGFHVIPLGYAPKKKRNPFREIEWRIVFPKAERYLEQHLTSAQVKVYMLAKALIKSFVEPVESNKALMFALDHLRIHLFWECERDYTAWPEELLGEVLLRFLNTFKQRVKEKQLNDYFIRERNLFESIPEYSLNTLHTILADITANPTMHLMIALRNLEFTCDFFPKLNVKKIYENLFENDMIKLKTLAKNGRSLINLTDESDIETCLMLDEGAKGLVGMKQHHVRTNGKLRRKTHLLRHTIEMKKQEMQARRRSMESIDVEFFFKRHINSFNSRQINQGVENLRRTNILEILLDHLLDMSAKAIQFKVIVVGKTYLSQARRLCKCYHNYGCDIGAKEYLTFIHKLDEELHIVYGKEDFSMAAAHSLPRRISVEPALPEIPKFAETNTFNLYEEMVPKENILISAGPKRDLKFRNEGYDMIEKVMEGSDNTSPLHSPEVKKSIHFCTAEAECKTEIKTCLKSPSKIMSPIESRKSIKFRDKVITVHQHQDDLSFMQKSQLGILRTKDEPRKSCHKNFEEKLNQEKENKISCDDPTHADKKCSLSAYFHDKLKSSAEYLNSTAIGHTELFQNVSQNTNQFFNHITADEKRAQIREMLKSKTLKLKGVFNQCSDT